MQKILILILFIGLTGCKVSDPTPEDENPNPPYEGGSSLSVAAFNIQVFGVTKMSKPEVVNVLVKTVSRYDLVLIQEIRDSGGSTIVNFMQQLNDYSGNKYSYIIGTRLGRSSSKEQYAYIYNKNNLRVLDSFDYNDVGDIFEREPFVALFEFLPTGDIFFTIGLHAKPADVINELNQLDNVYSYAEDVFNSNKSIIMGDLNADCTYLSDAAESSLHLKTDPQFNWHISKSVDTTVGSTNCAYDRIITTGSISSRVNKVEIFNFLNAYNLTQSQGEDVSDHYPVSITVGF